MLPGKPLHRMLNTLGIRLVLKTARVPLLGCHFCSMPTYRSFYDIKIFASIITKPFTSSIQGTAKSGSHMVSPNKRDRYQFEYWYHAQGVHCSVRRLSRKHWHQFRWFLGHVVLGQVHKWKYHISMYITTCQTKAELTKWWYNLRYTGKSD